MCGFSLCTIVALKKVFFYLGVALRLWVRLGIIHLEDEGGVERKIVSFVEHPYYSNPHLYFDVAVASMAEDVVITDQITPICLPLR